MYKDKKKKYKIFSFITILLLTLSFTSITCYAADKPEIEWVRIYDNYNTDMAYAITTDNYNNFIVTGVSKINELDRAYTIKYDNNGNYLLGITSDIPYTSKTHDVATDSQNNIIVVGGSLNTAGDYDYYIAKYNSTGNKLWNQSYNSGYTDTAYGVAIDSNDNIVVTGEAADNYYTVKYNKFGAEIWNKTFSAFAKNHARSVAIDKYDNIIVAGYVYTGVSRDWYTIKYNPNGQEIWNKTFSNGNLNYADSVTINSKNEIIVAGTIYRGSNSDIHLIKYDETGIELWSRTYDHSIGDYGSAVTTNAVNDIIVAGSVFETHQKKNYILVKYDSEGMFIWSTLFDRSYHEDYGCGVTVDTQNDICITGFSKTNFNDPYDFLTIKYKDTISQDIQEPEITEVNVSPNPQDSGGYVNISCRATDNIAVNTVEIHITDPDNLQYTTTMTPSGNNVYYYNALYTIVGNYSFYITAYDTSNNNNTSETHYFKILTFINNPPYQPDNPSPTDGSNDIDTNAGLTWTGGDPDGDTITYDVYFGTTNPPPKLIGNQSDTTYKPLTMNLSTVYYWQIISWDSRGGFTQGPIWSFTTISAPNTPPNVANTPQGQTSGFIYVAYEYNTSAIDIDDDAISYGWDWNGDGTVDEWSNWYDSGEICTMSHSWDVPGTYDIRVKTRDICLAENETWSNALSVTIENNPPNKPSNPHPANGSTNVGLNVGLWWAGGDLDGDLVTYDVYFEANNPNPSILVSENQTDNYYTHETLNNNTQYYWQIIAKDTHESTSISDIWEFTTKQSEQNNAPNKPSNPHPANGSIDINTTATLTVYVSDPDGDSLTVKFYNASNSSLIGTTVVQNNSNASFQWSGLNYKTTYSWYAVANDSVEENISDIWIFTTKNDTSNGNEEDSNESTTGKKGFTGNGFWPTNNIPVANAGGPYFGFPSEKIEFNASESYAKNGKIIVGYRWDFNNNGTYDTDWLTTPFANHTYPVAGEYTVTLQVKDSSDLTNTDTTTATILAGNYPPTKPEVSEENLTGNINILYGYTAASTDPENDTIQYVFDWGDGTNTTTDFLPNATIATANHSWVKPGKYTMQVQAIDHHNAYSLTNELTVLIDAKNIGEIGYLTDDDGDGRYDTYHSNNGTIQTPAEQIDDKQYLLDTTGDSEYNHVYTYNEETEDWELIEYKPSTETTDDDSTLLYTGAVLLIIILLLLFFLATRKKDKK